MLKVFVFTIFTTTLVAQNNVQVGNVAINQEANGSLIAYLQQQLTGRGTALNAPVAIGDTAVGLFDGSQCTLSYAVTNYVVAGGVATLAVATSQVPTGTRITISGNANAGANGTFATTSAPSGAPSLTFASALPNGAYTAIDPSMDNIALTLNHCGIKIESEALEVVGFNGTAYTVLRGIFGTAAAEHDTTRPVQFLKYASTREFARGVVNERINYVVSQFATPKMLALQAQITALQSQIDNLRSAAAQ